MTAYAQDDDIVINNNRSFNSLIKVISRTGRQRFSLIFVRCNYAAVRDEMLQRLEARLKEELSFEAQEITISRLAKSLYVDVQSVVEGNQPPVCFVFGLELLSSLDDLLISANQERDKFKESFAFPLVLWVDDLILQKLLKLAPDFSSWAGVPLRFTATTHELTASLRKRIESIFSVVTDNADFEPLQPNSIILGSNYYSEIQLARKELEERGQTLDLETIAKLNFIYGREEYHRKQFDTAIHFYQESLAFFEKNHNSVWEGVLLFHLGICYFSKAELDMVEAAQLLLSAKDSLRQSLDCFRESQRLDLVAKFINFLGKTLQNLQDWEALEKLSKEALELVELGKNPVRMAEIYGFLSGIKFARQDWRESIILAQKALESLKKFSSDRPQDKASYLLLLAKSQQQNGEFELAVDNLLQAKSVKTRSDTPLHKDHLHLYIRILETLRILYYQQEKYFEAFQVKQEQYAIEQQYRMRAFIGAGRLQPKRQEDTASVEVAEEIIASGRLKDLNDLVDKISIARHKLIVVHGQSGVGKSSLMQAGLVPALSQRTIEARNIVPISVWTYAEWVNALEREVKAKLSDTEQIDIAIEQEIEVSSLQLRIQNVLDRLRQSIQDRIIVIVFDQFEEFFFICKEKSERRIFFEFLRDCLKIEYLKIVISLREDYIHYLFECERVVDLESIGNDILTIHNRHYLGNFSRESAESIIKSLATRSQFEIQSQLAQKLVQELAGDSDEVRPIELQIVGAQLQSARITTLDDYKKYGKNELVKRYLKEIIVDCGPLNKRSAALLLYLLTDENNTRPSKTYSELLSNFRTQALEQNLKADSFDDILRIFVESGLILLIPSFPDNRYQLVHDYLVLFIRELWIKNESLEMEKVENLASEKSKTQDQTARNVIVGNDIVIGDINQQITFNHTQIIQISVDAVRTRPLIVSSPYKGLRGFSELDKDYFFGRDQLIYSLVQELSEQNFVFLVGASGSGKSSLVQAGLIPRFSEILGSNFTSFTLKPDTDPFEALYQNLLRMVKQSEAQLAREAQSSTFSKIIQAIKPRNTQWLIFIDQFEELFTLTNREKRNAFIEGLTQVIRAKESSVKLVLAMRADFLDQLTPYPAFAKSVQRSLRLITEMATDELRLAIEQPASRHGVVFEEGLVREIIQDVQGQAGYLPLLQFTLHNLWELEVKSSDIDDRTLNIKTYRMLGGVRGAFEQYVEEFYNSLSNQEKLITRSIFLRLVSVLGEGFEGDRVVARRALISEFSSETEQHLLGRLISSNLLVSSSAYSDKSSAATVEIAHEVLLISWARLKEWVAESREAIKLLNRLNEDAIFWRQSQKMDEELWMGSKLEMVLALRNDSSFNQTFGGFSSIANEFVDASLQFYNRQQRKAFMRRRMIIGIISFTALLLFVLSLLNLIQYQRLKQYEQKGNQERQSLSK